MKPIQVSTIILGSWNPRIFKPSWIKTNLFGLNDGQELQGMVNFDDMEFGFHHNGINLFPRMNLLEVNFDGYSVEKAELAASTVVKVLELLPQTPIKALGINIRYVFKRNDNNPFINTINKIKCKYLDFDLNQIKQTKNIDNYQVNIITDILQDTIQTNFNFHYAKIAPFDCKFIAKHFEESQKILKYGN